MLSRKYYKLIAQVIKDNTIPQVQMRDTLNKYNLINDLCVEFKKDNNLFNRDKFIDACD
tara:strand:+ start:338 stop:514 length:177 start_codon:yes stop_codon:yes gene_type:complete